MKHDRSHRRDVRRHADPSVICLPGPKLPYTPPRKEPEVTGATATGLPIPDDDVLDAELLAHKNIFDAPPRMSRQARRKALRAEKKAARRAATERFLVGAPSLGEAAQQVAMEPLAGGIASGGIASEDAALLEDALMADAEMIAAEPESPESEAPKPGRADAVEEEVLALETIAQIISATGPLIVPDMDMQPMRADNDMRGLLELAPLSSLQDAPPETMAQADAGEPATTAAIVPSPQIEFVITPEPSREIPIEAMTKPLPRSRALVPARRNWLMRLMPWRGPRRSMPAPEPALAQLQELRFELAMAMRRLDRMIDGIPEGTPSAH